MNRQTGQSGLRTRVFFDAVIIGGGPAGCSAAITLARAGIRTALVEEKRYPHDKLCGEFLSPEALDLLRRLDMARRFRALRPVSIDHVLITAPDGTPWRSDLPGNGWGLSRRALDTALAAQATAVGVEVWEGTKATNVEGSFQTGFAVETRGDQGRSRMQARAVIAAHGKRSNLDRVLNRPFFRRDQRFVALKAHFFGPPIPGRVELHAFPGGYCGLSEIEDDRRVVCLLAHTQALQRASGLGHSPAEGLVSWMQTQNRHLQAWLGQAERIHEDWISIAQVPFGNKRVVVNDVLMAGDAAGLIAPLAGDGICMALEGGMLAAHHLAGFLAGEISEAALRQGYQRAWQQRFGRRLRLGRALQALMLQPRALAPALRVLSAVPSLGGLLLRATRGGERDAWLAKQRP